MSDEHPITLAMAAKEYGFGVDTLRAEADKGHLAIYRVGKRLYTTRKDVREMLFKCRVDRKARGFTLTESDLSGSLETERISSARAALWAKLNGPASS